MRNEFHHVSFAQMKNKLKEKKENTLVVEIDGGTINSWEEFHRKVAELLGFPLGYEPNNIDGFLDWMRDFSWFDPMPGTVMFVIWHYDSLMKNRPEDRETVIRLFKKCILPFWESEVEEVVVEGKAMPFDVYLVD